MEASILFWKLFGTASFVGLMLFLALYIEKYFSFKRLNEMSNAMFEIIVQLTMENKEEEDEKGNI